MFSRKAVAVLRSRWIECGPTAAPLSITGTEPDTQGLRPLPRPGPSVGMEYPGRLPRSRGHPAPRRHRHGPGNSTVSRRRSLFGSTPARTWSCMGTFPRAGAAKPRSRGCSSGYEPVMEHFVIATVAEQNPDFRRVLWTGKHTQLVVMTIPPGGEIGEEVHPDTDQILTFVSGVGEATVAGEKQPVAQGDLVVRPGRHQAQLRQHRPEPAGPLHRLRAARARRRRGAPHQGGGRGGRGVRPGRASAGQLTTSRH